MHLLTGLFVFWAGGALASAPTALAIGGRNVRLVALVALGWPLFGLGAALGLVKFKGGEVEEA